MQASTVKARAVEEGRGFPSGRSWFLVALGVTAAAVLAVGVRAALDGWLPVGDDGYFALRAHDVFTSRPPLLGTSSTVSLRTGTFTNHPGPLQFYVLALPVALLGVPAGVTVGTAAVNAASVAAAGLLIRRTVGDLAGVAVVAGFGTLAWAMGSVQLHSPYGPTAAVVPFGLYVVAVACAAAGEVRALPVAALAGSFVLQTHLSYALVVPTLAVVAVAGVVVRARSSDGPARAGRWLAGSGLLALVCWAPVFAEQLREGSEGNLASLLRGEGQRQVTAGLDGGLVALARRVATPTLWMPPDFDRPVAPVVLIDRYPSWPVALMLLAAVAAALGGAGRRSWQRGDRVAVTAVVTAGVALAAGYASAVNAPVPGVVAGNYIRYLWPVSLWLWFTLALVAVREWGRNLAPVVRPRVAAAGAGVCVVVALLMLPHADRTSGRMSDVQGTADEVVAAAMVVVDDHGAVDDHRPVLVHYTRSRSFWTFGPLVMAELADAGVPFVVDTEAVARQVGPNRFRTEAELAADPPAVTLVLADPGQPPEVGRLVEHIPADPDRVPWGGVDVHVVTSSHSAAGR